MTANVLSNILQLARFQGSMFFNAKLAAPWGLSLDCDTHPRFHIVLSGACVLQHEHMNSPLRLAAGDMVMVTGNTPHWIADQPGRKLVPSGEATQAISVGKPLFQGDGQSTRLLCGKFGHHPDLPHALFTSLPPVLHIARKEPVEIHWLSNLSQLLFSEYNHCSAITDRLCEVLFIKILQESEEMRQMSTGIIAALRDRYLCPTLEKLHQHPERDWSLQEMAKTASLSRSAFAERFHRLVGSSPKLYLRNLRLHKALNLLRDTEFPVSRIALEVGYSSDSVLNRNLRKTLGKSSSQIRQEHQVRTLQPH